MKLKAGFAAIGILLLLAMFACPAAADRDSLNQELNEMLEDKRAEESLQSDWTINFEPVDMDIHQFIQTFDEESETGFDCALLCPDYEYLKPEECLEQCEQAGMKIRENRNQPPCEQPENMVLVPAGSFCYGLTDDNSYLEILNMIHGMPRTILTKDFYIDIYEVTQSDFEAVMGFNPAYYQGKKCGPQCPVESVTYEEAEAYCAAVGKRLPTNAEWEYAAKAGATTRHYWGNEINLDYLWYKDNSGGRPKPVGQKLPNAYGLFDMEGNVFEYVQDCAAVESPDKHRGLPRPGIIEGIGEYDFPVYAGGFYLMPTVLIDPQNIKDECSTRLIKGSSFAYEGKPAAPHDYEYQDVTERRGDRGFRCVMDVYGPHCANGQEDEE